MLAKLELAFATLAAGGCYLDMPLGDIDKEVASDGDADGDSDADTDSIDVCVEWQADECRIPVAPPPEESAGAAVASSDPLYGDSWTFTSLQADTTGRLYAFFWWVPAAELGETEVPVDHLAWRTRGPDEDSWSEIRALSGVSLEDRKEARCATPSSAPLQFTTTDDGYVHAFWRKNPSCRGGDVFFFEHAMFVDGHAAFREEMPIECAPGRDLRMTDTLAVPNGGVLVSFLCGPDGRIQTFRCGCWNESTLVSEDNDPDRPNFLPVQSELALVEHEREPWIVVQTDDHDLWARRLDDPAAPESYLLVSDAGNAFGTPVAFSDDQDGLWIVWQPDLTPSVGLEVASFVDGGFDTRTHLPGGTGDGAANVQAIDGGWVPGRGPMILSEETRATRGTLEGEPTHVEDSFFVRTFDGDAWTTPFAAATHETDVGLYPVPRHTASDLAIAGGVPSLAYVTYGIDEHSFELRVVEVP